jgi:hypothetical protein
MSAYEARLTKQRSTKSEMAARREVLRVIIEDGGPMSVRQAYYRAVVVGIVPKTNAGYQRIQRTILQMRRNGDLDYNSIVDNTRWMRKPTTWRSAREALVATARTYRQDLWSNSDYLVEVWVESDSIAGSVYQVTDLWDVALMACRGFSSETFAYNAAEAWKEADRVPVVIYIGDHDPHGLEIENTLRDRLQGFYEFPAFIRWTRLGVTWEQVVDLDLPGTPPKKEYGFELAVEAEALPAQHLRDLLDEQIEQYVDEDQLRVLRAAERSEREVLLEMAKARGAA